MKKMRNKIGMAISERIMKLTGKIKENFDYRGHVANDDLNPKVSATGYMSEAAAAGYYAEAYNTGLCGRIAIAGDCGKAASTGNEARVAMAGDIGHIITAGERARVAVAGSARIASYGDGARISTEDGHIQLFGKNSVGACIGRGGSIKGKLGDWVVLAEWDDYGKLLCVKSARIDGETLLPDKWYTLKGGEFKEVEEVNVQWWDIAENNV